MEVYRPITVREGDRTERIPIIQAIIRKVAVAAANGNGRALQQILNRVDMAEAARRAGTMEMLKVALEYKERWNSILAERARDGTTGPEPVPHPDDIIIDYETGEVRIEGPVLEEQKDAQDALHAKWPDLERDLRKINEKIESNPNDLSLRKEQKELTKIVEWIREDAGKRSLRDATRELMAGKRPKAARKRAKD
jgi:hypothetical protein